MKPGLLIKPKLSALKIDGSIYLTPLENAEENDWPEWKRNELGIVLPLCQYPDLIGVLVMVPNGIGLCFHDEVEIVQ